MFLAVELNNTFQLFLFTPKATLPLKLGRLEDSVIPGVAINFVYARLSPFPLILKAFVEGKVEGNSTDSINLKSLKVEREP